MTPTINYPERYKSFSFEYREGYEIKVKRGQLMGHPLSFPLLCILNASVCLYYLRKYEGYKGSAYKMRSLVNGDDMVFRASENFNLSNFISCANLVGFQLNTNKTLISRRVGSLNSRRFIFGANDTVRLIPQLITSIVSDKTNEVDWDNVLEYSVLSKEYFERTVRIYLKCRSKEQKALVPWNLPRSLGGLGIPTYDDEISLTPFQRNLTKKMIEDDLFFTESGVKTRF